MTAVTHPIRTVRLRSGRWAARSGQVEAEGATEDEACRALAMLLALAALAGSAVAHRQERELHDAAHEGDPVARALLDAQPDDEP